MPLSRCRLYAIASILVFCVLYQSAPAHAFWLFGKKQANKDQMSAVSEAYDAQSELSLIALYNLALKKSQGVNIKELEIEQAKASIYRSAGVILPSITFDMSLQRQDPSSQDSAQSGVGSSILREKTYQKKFVFSQPIFSGFKEIAALRSSAKLSRQKKYELRRAQQLLFIDIVDAYYWTLESQKDHEILTAIAKLLEDKIQAMRQRVEIGKSRESELQTLIAEWYATLAQAQEAQGVLQSAFYLLEFYTDALITHLPDDSGPIDMSSSLAEFESMSAQRSDVMASQMAYELAQSNVTVAQSGLLPKVYLSGNYYTQREGFQSGVDWDTTLVASIPIFDAMDTVADIKDAHAAKQIADERFSQSKDTAKLEIRQAYAVYRASEEKAKSLRLASEAAQSAYESVDKDFDNNLVSHLEVIDALRASSNAKRQYFTSQYESRRNVWKLKATAGETP